MSRGAVRVGLFILWAGLLAYMVVVIQTRIVPVTGMALQPRWAGYTYADITHFGVQLLRTGLGEVYRDVLVLADSAFVLCFGLWVALDFRRWPWFGVILAVTYAAADLGENVLLYRELSWSWGVTSEAVGWVLFPPASEGGTPIAAAFTVAKLLLFSVLTFGIFLRDWVRWRRA
ncbi:hypothetical protein [Maritimibacter sp. DP1N21-5]|uniref:hypothetical protein n=1 Tax=Maritimibacter sp. DP1N21-5 TaxID=2836867 RepID=UPI001C4854C6|nr:hypothetical protein [Maritimibacter sp. DP1N21-5]MBV7408634.1 hypothetical protein [Maritimibacter sp. DP1N21-5]